MDKPSLHTTGNIPKALLGEWDLLSQEIQPGIIHIFSRFNIIRWVGNIQLTQEYAGESFVFAS